MIDKQTFLALNEELIEKVFIDTVGKLVPELEINGYFKDRLQYTCVPGVVIEVQRQLQEYLYEHGWIAEIDFSMGRSGPLLDIKVY